VNDTLRVIPATDQVDLLLPRNFGGFRDLIELERPDMSVVRWDDSHRNWYWSADASKASASVTVTLTYSTTTLLAANFVTPRKWSPTTPERRL
jgi:hypothetical protein